MADCGAPGTVQREGGAGPLSSDEHALEVPRPPDGAVRDGSGGRCHGGDGRGTMPKNGPDSALLTRIIHVEKITDIQLYYPCILYWEGPLLGYEVL